MNMVARKKVFRLTDEQNYKLCKWAEMVAGDLEERRLSKEEAVSKAREAMAIEALTIFNVERAARACGIKLRFRKPKRGAPMTVHKRRIATIAKYVAEIYKALNGTVPDELAEIFGGQN